MVLLELVRRLMLAGGIAGFFALALTTVPALVLVAPVDFAAEMAREYRIKPGPRPMGVMELGEELIQRTTKPGSLQEYIERRAEHRLDQGGRRRLGGVSGGGPGNGQPYGCARWAEEAPTSSVGRKRPWPPCRTGSKR